MRNPVFKTDRLIVREACDDDLPLLLALWADPRVMTYVGFPAGIKLTGDEVTRSIRREAGIFDATLVVELKATGEAIGECRMGSADADGIAETDVKLRPEHWGQKYGVEVKRGLIQYIFAHQPSCSAIKGTPNLQNAASIAMQEAVGGVRVGEEIWNPTRPDATPVHSLIYLVDRRNWEASESSPQRRKSAEHDS